MKKVLVIILTFILIISMCACNRKGIIIDTQNQANWAIIKYPNNSIYIYEVSSWSEDEVGYTIKTKGGNVLFVDGMNCILTKDKPDESFGEFK